MKRCGFFTLLSFLPCLATAQSLPDTISLNAESVGRISSKAKDSLNSLASLSRFRDSLTINAWSDSLRAKVRDRFSMNQLDRFADSLRSLRVPEPLIARSADSLLRQKTSLLEEVGEKQLGLQQMVSARYQTWTTSLRRKYNLDSAGAKLPNADFGTSAFTPPGTDLPSMHSDQPTGLPHLPALESSDFGSLSVSPGLSAIGGPLTIPSAPQLGEWQKELPTMPDAMGELQVMSYKDLASDPSDAIEKGVTQIGEADNATKQLAEAEKVKEQAEVLKAAEQLKDPASVKEQAVNHFAGKEAELQGAVSQVAKYKKKYSSIGSLSEIPKNDWLPRNGLKGKPFIERFRPGMNLGVHGNSDTVLVDIYPNVAYRITGRIESGLGGIYRLRVPTNPFGFDQQQPVWGVAIFMVVKTFRSVFIRLETDGTSHVKQNAAEQSSYRDWRWSFHTGIQTNFKISKRVTGNVQALYNFDSSLKDGFPERLTARLGVQYKLKK